MYMPFQIGNHYGKIGRPKLMLTLKGKELYTILVGQSECGCNNCVCKFQYSCIACTCCITNHCNIYRPVSGTKGQIIKEIRTEIYFE